MCIYAFTLKKTRTFVKQKKCVCEYTHYKNDCVYMFLVQKGRELLYSKKNKCEKNTH